MKIVALGVVLGLGVATLPSLARADESALLAKEHFRRGTTAYNLGHFIEAASEYEQAYRAKESPALLYNLGQAYRGAGEPQKALNAYRAYLRSAPDAPNGDEVVHFIEALKHTIEMQKATTEKPPVGTIPETPPHATAPPTVVAPQPKKREPNLHELALGRKLRLAGIGIGAVAVASVVVGSVLAGETGSVAHQLNNPTMTAPVYDKSLDSRGRTYQAVSIACIAVGGAALVAGVGTFVAGTVKVKHPGYALAPAIGPQYAGVAFAASF
jgi:tetratricopeptide (TPR) repeat protein